MKCVVCNGTRLDKWGEYRSTVLYTENECKECGGKGYVREGEREYVVGLFADTIRIYQFFVLARNAAEALFLAAEMFVATKAEMCKTGEELTLGVEEQ